jgi:E3 Ubiquitin ligase
MAGAFVLVMMSALFLLIGLAQLWSARVDRQRRRRVLDTPTSTIAGAKGGVVQIHGRAAAGDAGTLVAPLSGKAVIWFNVQVLRERGSGRSRRWVTAVDEARGVPFLVDDGSGEQALVDSQGAYIVVDPRFEAHSGFLHDATPALEAFLVAHGMSSRNVLGLNSPFRYRERVLEPGDALSALGPTSRENSPQGTRLVMRSAGGAGDAILLSDRSSEQLASRLNRGWKIGVGISAVCAAGVVLGVILMIVLPSPHRGPPARSTARPAPATRSR